MNRFGKLGSRARNEDANNNNNKFVNKLNKIRDIEQKKTQNKGANRGNSERSEGEKDAPGACAGAAELIQAVSTMNFGAVKDLWFRFPNSSAAARDQAGLTPMHIAAKNGDKECLSFLLAKGQDLNAVDNGRNTPLHYAVSGSFTKCI